MVLVYVIESLRVQHGINLHECFKKNQICVKFYTYTEDQHCFSKPWLFVLISHFKPLTEIKTNDNSKEHIEAEVAKQLRTMSLSILQWRTGLGVPVFSIFIFLFDFSKWNWPLCLIYWMLDLQQMKTVCFKVANAGSKKFQDQFPAFFDMQNGEVCLIKQPHCLVDEWKKFSYW